MTKPLHQPMLTTLMSHLLFIFFVATLPTQTSSLSLRLDLRHVDAGAKFSNLELMQRALQRSKARNAMNRAKILSKLSSSIGQAVGIGVKYRQGEYLFDVSFGTPPKLYSLILDTGSDLIWMQCNPCLKCEPQPEPFFNATASSSYALLPCKSPQCKALPQFSCQSKNVCVFRYSYGDGTFAIGLMGRETLTFGADKSVSVPHFAFGCGLYDDGTLSGSAGLGGFSKGPLSVITQLRIKKFALCLATFNTTQKSSLFFDELADINKYSYGKTIQSTSIVDNPFITDYYYVSLKGITVGSTRLQIISSNFEIKSNGSGGVIVDSGTQYTMLETSSYEAVKKAFVSQANVHVAKVNESLDFELCFHAESNVVMPKLVMHFDGADLSVPQDNYFLELEKGLLCLAILDAGGIGEMSTIGNYLQQNMFALHDLEHKKLSWVSAECDKI